MLEVYNLTRKYGVDKGIFDLSYTFKEGMVYALIGPNGAGKTTLINMIAGISEPDIGQVKLDGKNTLFRECKCKIGYAIPLNENKTKQTIMQFLDMVCAIKYDGKYMENIINTLTDFGLDSDKDMLLTECSYGMLKKIEIIASFIGFPKLIILDEPTNGIDTRGVIELKKYIAMAREKRCIVIVSSHVLDFTDAIKDETLFLKNGHLIEEIKTLETEEQYKQLFLI